MLAGLGALRAGAGLVTLVAHDPETRAALDAKAVEAMTAVVPPSTVDAADAVSLLAARAASAAVGPGFGLDDRSRELAVWLAKTLSVPTVLDADALTALADADGGVGMLRDAAGPRVLTPHPGEAARLLGCAVALIQSDRLTAAREIARRAGHVTVLKGARTVVASPSGLVHVCRRGTPALGVAGTGDVLTGVVAAHLASHEPQLAASVAVVLHAVSGELAAVGDRGLRARDVGDGIPAALQFCWGSSA
jgi:NAD(P)H-hydrate epimerase